MNIKNVIVKIIIVLFTLTLTISLYILNKDFSEFKEINDANNNLVTEVVVEDSNEKKTEIEWEKLEYINKDIIGWINIANTNINYPILKDDDDLKYLNHSFNGEYNKNGSIFTINENPFQDNVTVLYGHNMKSGIMFSELGKYLNKNFFDEHRCFEIYTKNQNYKATIFSCYSTGINEEENNLKLLNFNDEIEYYKNKSKFNYEGDIGKIKKIVKLSTCSYLNNHTTPTNQRYYIVAKLEEMY